ncbi:MAG TPA: FliA/WhiG family RNA polymerase sigma factor [Candidatus Binatia bacterium]|nr:FliA/WhiG family RNA polymerase sigma factor [Candidatus Binatia bacterium]
MKTSQSENKEHGAALAETARQTKEERVTQYLPLVRLVAEKVHRRLPPGVDLESLIHSGVVGLLQALDRFDPKRGVDFEIYARYRIQGEVMQCLRSLDWVRRSVRSWGRKIEAAKARLASTFAREPTAEEIAKELEIPLESYFRLDQQVSEATLLSLEDLSMASEAEWERAQEKYTDGPFLDPLSVVEGKDLVEKLASGVAALPERDRLVVTLYYYEELTLREIGQILDLSEGRVCQILAQVVACLRGALGIKSPVKLSPRRAQEARKQSAKKSVRV